MVLSTGQPKLKTRIVKINKIFENKLIYSFIVLLLDIEILIKEF